MADSAKNKAKSQRQATRANTGDLDSSTTNARSTTSTEPQNTAQQNSAEQASATVDQQPAAEQPPKNKGGAQYRYTPEELSAAVEEYVRTQREHNLPIHKSGFAVKMNVCADTVTDWLNSDNTGYSEPIKRLETASLAYKNDFLYSGKNPAGAIFDLKNNHGWVDRSEVVQSGEITHRLELPNRDRLSAVAGRLSGEKPVIDGEFEPVS